MRTRRHSLSPRRRPVIPALVLALLALAAGPAMTMPPPAPGNERGLPESVREQLRRDPDLFYPRTGFRPVIERMKRERREVVRRLAREGYSLLDAQEASLSRVTTTRYAPVLCGLYADKGTPDWPVGDLVDELFSLDYGATNTLGQPGSMREHYLDMSYGTFDLQGGVFGWYALPENGAYYYSDDNGLGADRAEGEAGAYIRHTLEAADPTLDFSLYDNDGPDNIPNSGDDDGVVDLVMFVHPNEGGECGGSEIWSHSFVYSGWEQHTGPFVTDDMGANGQPLVVEDYVIMPAISCSGGRIEIGVFSHEFGHALGLPDLYDRTAYDPAGAVSTGGIGLYGLMAAGSYGGDYSHAETPTQMCAWSKEQLGWLSPREIVCDETLALYPTDDTPEAVKLWTGGDYSTGEYFLVENRQRKKWDRYLLGEGLLITHIDNNVLTQNDEACPGGNPCLAGHYLVMVIEADNQWEMQTAAPPLLGPWFGEAEDFFSAENNDTWNDLTLPSSRDHGGGLTGVSVSSIGPSGDKMFADFSVSQTCQAAPVLAAATSAVSGGCDLDGFLDPGETVSLDVVLRNAPTGAPATGITGTLTSLDPEAAVVSGVADFPDLGRGKLGSTIVPFRIQASAAAACSTQASFLLELSADGGYAASETVTVSVGIDSLFVPLAFADDIESPDENGWRHYAYINEDDWSHSTNANHTTGAIPGSSWFTEATATGKDVSLEPPPFIPSATTVVSFWHRYDTEDDWDGCLLELSLDGGKSWIDVGDDTNVGYDDQLTVNPQSSIGGRRAWNGLNASYPLFDQVTLDMSPYAGQTCILRFRLGCDLASTGVVMPGWNIDDYQVTDASILRERCEETAVCTGVETDPPAFAGLASAVNPNLPACDGVDLEWEAADDASGPVTYLVYGSESTPVPTTAPIASTGLLRYRVTGLTPNGTYHFLVRARDSQGNVDANQAERSVTLACDPPDFEIVGTTLTETSGCDGDDRPDAGEKLALEVTVRNASGSDAKNVAATLRTLSPRVAVLSGTATYGDLNAQHFEEGSSPFEILVGSPACMTPATLALDITADGGTQVTRTIDLLLESDVDLQMFDFTDDMEGTEPNGFTHSADGGTDDWGYTTSDSRSPSHAWFHPDAGGITDASLVSPPLYVSSTSVLTFWHKYVLEDGYDGGVLEISIDGGETWQDVGQSYNSSQDPTGPAYGSPFAPGRPFWSGSSGGFVEETVNLGAMTSPLGTPLYAGETALLRWRIGCDNTNSSPPFEGWWIDDVSLTGSGTFTTVCDACSGVLEAPVPGPAAATVLAQNAPNPLRGQGTRIRFRIGENDGGPATLRVFSSAGRLVRTLLESPLEPGSYDVGWDGADPTGRPTPAGIYFYELSTRGERRVKKLVKID